MASTTKRGKSTLGKTVMGIYTPTAGAIRFAGREIGRLPRRERRAVAKDLQYVYQDPGASLDPRWKIGPSLHEPLKMERPPERAQDLQRARRGVVGVDLEAQQGVDVEIQQLVQCSIHRPNQAPPGGLRRRRPDLLRRGIPGDRPARPPHGYQLRCAEQDLLVHRGVHDLIRTL